MRFALRYLAPLALALGLVTVPQPAPAAAATPYLQAMTFNICGAACNRGSLRVADYTARRIARVKPGVVFLQEVCHSQFRRIKSKLAGRGYSFTFARQRYAPRCSGGYGVALVFRGTLLKREVRKLARKRGYSAARVALGVTARVQGRTMFLLSVHNATGVREGNPAHLRQLKSWMDSKVWAGLPVVAGGDWNASPWAPGIRAISKTYRDLDYRDNQGTFDRGMRKIDYIFVSRHFTSVGGITLPSRISDHRVYLGRAR